MLKQNASQAAIARAIGKSRSSVSRELQRNGVENYCAQKANDFAKARQAKATALNNSLRRPKKFPPIRQASNPIKPTKPQHYIARLKLFPSLNIKNLRLRMDFRIGRQRKAQKKFVYPKPLIPKYDLHYRNYLMESLSDQRSAEDKKHYRITPRQAWKLLLRMRERIYKYRPRDGRFYLNRLSHLPKRNYWSDMLRIDGKKSRISPIVHTQAFTSFSDLTATKPEAACPNYRYRSSMQRKLEKLMAL
jgi:hypothetical protein